MRLKMAAVLTLAALGGMTGQHGEIRAPRCKRRCRRALRREGLDRGLPSPGSTYNRKPRGLSGAICIPHANS
jgi:hypothetical protein